MHDMGGKKTPVHHGSFVKDVLKMTSAPLFTQIMGMILMPVVTRLYSPESFGLFSLFGSLVMPICVFATMGYNSSMVLPHKEEDAANMLFISIASTVIISVLTVPLIWLGSGFIVRSLKAPVLAPYLWLVPITVFEYGLYLSLRYWNVRGKRFGIIALSKISDAVVDKVITIGAGLSGLATAGTLIISNIVGSLSMSGILGKGIWKENKELFRRSITWNSVVRGIKRYRKFPVFILGTEMVSRISDLIVMFLFSFYFSKSVIGYYGLGLAVLSVPSNFIGSSIGEVFYQRGARASSEDSGKTLVKNIFKHMTILFMLPFLVLALIGDSFFVFCFGPRWLEAGIFAQILSFRIFASLIMGPILNLTSILEKQESMFIFYVVTAVVGFISITAGGLLNNVYVGVGLLSLLNGIVVFALGLFMVHFVGLPVSEIMGDLSKCFISCLPVIIIIAIAKWYFMSPALPLIIISAFCCLVYYAMLFKRDRGLQSIIMGIFKKPNT